MEREAEEKKRREKELEQNLNNQMKPNATKNQKKQAEPVILLDDEVEEGMYSTEK